MCELFVNIFLTSYNFSEGIENNKNWEAIQDITVVIQSINICKYYLGSIGNLPHFFVLTIPMDCQKTIDGLLRKNAFFPKEW